MGRVKADQSKVLFWIVVVVTLLSLAGCDSGYSRAARLEAGVGVWRGWSILFLAVAALASVWGTISYFIHGTLGNTDKSQASMARQELNALKADMQSAAEERNLRALELKQLQMGMTYSERLALELEHEANSRE